MSRYMYITNKIWSMIIKLTIVSFALLNVQLYTIIGAGFKLIHFVFLGAIVAAISYGYIHRNRLIIGMFFLALPMFCLYRINDMTEWIKSYFIWAIMIMFLMFAFPLFVKEFRTNRQKYINLFLGLIAFIQVLGIIQFLLMNFAGIHFLKNMWGGFQFQPNLYGMKSGFYRAYSLFYEPSVLGWVSTSSLTVVLLHNKINLKNYWLFLILDCIGVAITISASGLFIFVSLIVAYQFIKSGGSGRKFISILLVFIVGIFLWNFTSMLDPLKRIITEIGTENTSGYERLTTPLMYVKKTLEYYPILGRGLGQEGFVDNIGIVGMYPGVNNGLFGVVMGFGLSSLAIYGFVLNYMFRQIKKHCEWLLLGVNLIGIYASTGAYCSLDVFMFAVILLAVGTCIGDMKDEQTKLQ